MKLKKMWMMKREENNLENTVQGIEMIK